MSLPFDYDLPLEKIALFPAEQRANSHLLVYHGNTIEDNVFSNLHNLLPHNCLILRNSSKVVKSRLFLKRSTGSTIEVFCLGLRNHSRGEALAECMIRNVRKLKIGEILTVEKNHYSENMHLTAGFNGREEDHCLINFQWEPAATDFYNILEVFGVTPLPPYINRKATTIDGERYQTVYASEHGSVAAPTAGLHFTESLEQQILSQGHQFANVILHVGAGTFKPMKTNNFHEHNMHREFFTVSKQTLSMLAENANPVVCVGTTTLRTLESLYVAGHFINDSTHPSFVCTEQFDAEKITHFIPNTLIWQQWLDVLEKHNSETITGSTSLMVTPSHICNTIDYLITNFHQPNSTLLLIVASIIGDDWKQIYRHALDNNYRFLSYGDATFLKNIRKKS